MCLLPKNKIPLRNALILVSNRCVKFARILILLCTVAADNKILCTSTRFS